ncbi:peptide chain release factor N(5)-glutamine methyltransferase [Desulfosarcina sp. OttesenSCG-928-A07]|nr:peptide chain release factor N(5)-glutamine methyltransferase [Desulfosarcina sp. OttesenSCG-928-G17]MDL2329911.1 peptide chain release factor N(5)-glutamine methyltransferase [Desulfosarcina sp. OttesenSCG-928-A07]
MPNAQPVDPATWTILDLIRWTTRYFADRGLENPRSEAEILLSHALGTRRIELYLNHDKPVGPNERTVFKALVRRRAAGEPVAYITGVREFWSLTLKVNPAVLIPRPETECLVEAVLPFLERAGKKKVLDMGTGSGAIAIALFHEHPEHQYTAMDRSMDALLLARANARSHGMENQIQWFCGNWDEALSPKARFDLIISNPPYIPTADILTLQREVQDHEPRQALDGSSDGLFCLRHIISIAHRHLFPSGLLALEMGWDQAEAVRSLAAATGKYEPARILKDYSGHDRVAILVRKPDS